MPLCVLGFSSCFQLSCRSLSFFCIWIWLPFLRGWFLFSYQIVGIDQCLKNLFTRYSCFQRQSRWLIFILCIVILLSDNSISDGLQKWCGLLKMKLLAVVKCNLHTSIIWVLALVKMASFLVVVHLMGLLTGL